MEWLALRAAMGHQLPVIRCQFCRRRLGFYELREFRGESVDQMCLEMLDPNEERIADLKRKAEINEHRTGNTTPGFRPYRTL